ncbi:DUF2062 domain-containing protein [Paenibacillus filicis]|uniref:DUF2062 domain-containing protein n=1 Tax=Paenibacillus filicis TaxID=669464 RepID=A0ABU9DDM5_9BACL
MSKAAKPKAKFQPRAIGRWFKYKYLQLIRAKGGPAMVAMGFSIGLFVEMFTLPTAGLAFFLIFPLVYLLRGSVAAALIGFVFGKIIYIPFSFLHRIIGDLVLPHRVHGNWLHVLPHWLETFIKFNLKLFVGGVIDGLILGLIVFFPIKWTLEWFHQKRKDKRQKRKEQLIVH